MLKKLIFILAFSVLLLGGILAYDVVYNDGHALYTIFENQQELQKVEIEPYSFDYEYVPEEIKVEEEVVELEDIEELDEIADGETAEEDATEDQEEVNQGDFEYYYTFLSEKEKKVYRTMVKAFNNIESGNTIETLNDEQMNKVAIAVRNDHPELFYVEEMGYVHYMYGGQIQKTVLSVTYSDSKTAIESKKNMVESKASSILAQVPASADEYGKVKYIYETVINMTEYDSNSPDNQNIISVMLNGRSVCAGYAKTVQFLLNRMGINTTFVEGSDLKKGESHAWNLVKIDGDYYYLDATWGDTSYMNTGADIGNGGINYSYLNVTTDELLKNHAISNIVEMPNCTATDANYYVRENLYFYNYDEARLEQIFSEAKANGAKSVSFKCASLEAYDSMVSQLINNEKIFNYIGHKSSASYATDEDERTLCFWL